MQQHLRSADSHLLAVTHFRLNTHGQQPFSAANPMAWNSLLNSSRSQRSVQTVSGILLKRYLFDQYQSLSTQLLAKISPHKTTWLLFKVINGMFCSTNWYLNEPRGKLHKRLIDNVVPDLLDNEDSLWCCSPLQDLTARILYCPTEQNKPVSPTPMH